MKIAQLIVDLTCADPTCGSANGEPIDLATPIRRELKPGKLINFRCHACHGTVFRVNKMGWKEHE